MDGLTLVLIAAIMLFCLAAMFFQARRRYELALAMILLSPWVHFLFAPDIPETPEDMLSAAGSIEPSTPIRMGIVLFAGSIGITKLLESIPWSDERMPPVFFVLGAFILYALLSTGYSIDQSYTFVRTAEFIAFFGFLLGLFFWLSEPAHMDRAIDIFFLCVIVGTAANLCTLAFLPDRAWWWAAPDRLQGFMSHPNTLGGFCMVSYPILLWEYTRRGVVGKSLIAVMALMLLGMHILSGSRTTLAASLAGFALWQVILNRKALFILVVSLILFGGYFLMQSRLPSFERQESSQITYLTGRTEFWTGSVALAMERPILGYGYGVEGKVWEDPRFQSEKVRLWLGSAKSSLHNGYLSVLIGLGTVGLVLWLAALFPPVLGVVSAPVSPSKAVILVILMQVLMVNLFETVITTSRTLESITFWVFWTLAIRYRDFTAQEVT
ncbi:MAG: O-antigen ligase family protein [Desulfomonilia bacterium]